MRSTKHMALILSSAAIIGCASSTPAFDSNPVMTAPAATLESRAELAAAKVCDDAVLKNKAVSETKTTSETVIRFPPIFPSRAVRSGQVKVIYDLDDAGMPINIRVIDATEEIFVRPAVRSVARWKHSPKAPDKPASKRQDICSKITFQLQDERGRKIPTWRDIETKNETYKKYKSRS